MRIRGRFRPLVLVASLAGMAVLTAANWYVDQSSVLPPDGSASNPYVHIMDALNAPGFTNGDTVFVAPGVYNEDVIIDGIEVNLIGTQGAAVTVIQGTGTTSAVTMYNAGHSTLSRFTVTGGVACCGGGVEIIGDSPAITRSIITGNAAVAMPGYAGVGGGIDVYDATNVILRDNLVVDNQIGRASCRERV